ncbi:beta-glucosidase family protein [Pararobbsia silviterrae]|uniref:Beta-glucosidase n=1 Tax=Pararobbsia silviterrae TaxID=1792498 RepID=A0A494XF38_9BURK|nr:glycoside hydrolase family 3 C-terminal domain-containing protein [Pararobbsia silviterrae]RKP47096.1 beta-glucosidase [Pararobbsia silviterrae]
MTWLASCASIAFAAAAFANTNDVANDACDSGTWGGPFHYARDGASADARAAKLVQQLTLDEKIQLVHGTGMPIYGIGGPFPSWVQGAGYIPGITRLNIPPIASADSAAGVNLSGVNATPLPAPVALASTWNPNLASLFGARIAKELRVLGYEEGLGGGLNLAREPRDGRTFEYMGEDPVLTGTMSIARTYGTQAQGVIATVKHYAFNDQETNRMTSNSVVDERTMRETELLAFEIAVKGGRPGNVMCSYNLLNGTYACENPYILSTALNEWGFKGIVQSDWTATHSTVAAALAGLDEEQPGYFDTYFSSSLEAAVTAGTVPLSRLNDMVQRKLRTLIELGIYDNPPTPGGTVDTAAGNQDALTVAHESMVLLKNGSASNSNAPVLPLAANVGSIVVIGAHADVGVLSGGGSGGVPAPNGNAVTGCTASGFTSCPVWYKSSPLTAIQAKAPQAKVTFFDGTNASAAATAAATADVAIVFASQWEAEGTDLTTLSLPTPALDATALYDQNALITAVAAKAKRTIVVLENGSPVLMPWLGSVQGVLETWYPGIQGGQAIADVLFGDVNPSGKLPITFPQQDADLPQTTISSTDLNVVYSEGLAMGYRWYDTRSIEPLFPFGYGLSYTSFEHSSLHADADGDGNVTVTVNVKNTGAKAGADVVQVYASLPASLREPPKRLVGWAKVYLQSRQSQQVRVQIPAQRFATWDATKHQWSLTSGSYGIIAAASERDPNALTQSVSIRGSH